LQSFSQSLSKLENDQTNTTVFAQNDHETETKKLDRGERLDEGESQDQSEDDDNASDKKKYEKTDD